MASTRSNITVVQKRRRCKSDPSFIAKECRPSTENPKFHEYLRVENRKRSFESNWPFTCPVRVHELVEAGFFYTGKV